MKVSDCMKQDVISISPSASIGQAAALLASRRIGTLPVVDGTGCLIGLLTLHDLLALVLPDFMRLIENFDFVHDFGAIEARQPSPEMLARPVRDVMQPPVSVDQRCGLLRAFSILRQHRMLDLPVVTPDGRLAGIASRVDIGVALLASWRAGQTGGEG